MRENVLSKLSTDGYYEWNGQRKLLAEWSEVLGINVKTLYGRLEENWSIEEAFTTPVRKRTTKILVLPDGEEITPAHLADRLGVPRTTLYSQVEGGWSIQQILDRNQHTEKPKNNTPPLLLAYYRVVVKLVGLLDRNGQAPTEEWFSDLDACLDRIWDLDKDGELGTNGEEQRRAHSSRPTNHTLRSTLKTKPLTLEEANELRRQQAGHPMVINPNFDAERVRANPDVDNRHS